MKLVASGKVFTAFGMLSKFALGADIVNSGRGMMLALGCIQALKCNSNVCPVGVTTNDPQLVRGLHVPDKAERVARYHDETVHAFAEILGAMGYSNPTEIQRSDVYRRITDGNIRTYEDLYPSMIPGGLLDESRLPQMSEDNLRALRLSRADSFEATA